MQKTEEQKELDELFTKGSKLFGENGGRFKILENPYIYLFMVAKLNDLNDFFAVKVGDTSRFVYIRLEEWRKIYTTLVEIGRLPAYITTTDGERLYFRDYVVHDWLKQHGYIPVWHSKDTHTFVNEAKKNLNIPRDVISSEKITQEFYVHAQNYDKKEYAITVELIKQAVDDFAKDPERWGLTDRFSKNAVQKINYRDLPAENYMPFPYQEFAVKDLVTKHLAGMRTGLNKTLLDSGTGSGKSNMLCWSLKAFFGGLSTSSKNVSGYVPTRAENIDFDKVFSDVDCVGEDTFVVLTSGIPDVFDEFKKAIEIHGHFRNSMAYIGVNEYVASNGEIVKRLHEEGKKIVVLGVSLQNLAGRKDNATDTITTDENTVSVKSLKKVHELLEDEKISMVLGDEAHFSMFGEGEEYKAALAENDLAFSSSDKEKFRLNPEYGYIFATATTEKILVQDIFPKDSMVFVSQKTIDDQAMIENEKAIAAGDATKSPFFGKVERNYFALNLDPDYAFELDKNKKLVRPEVAKSVVAALWGKDKYSGMPPLMSDVEVKAAGGGRNVLMRLKSKAVCDQVEDILKEILGSDVHIANVSSARNSKAFKNVQVFKNFMKRHRFEKTVTLTVDRFSTGVSIDYWDTVVIATSGNSTTFRQQIMGRVFRSWVENIELKNSDGSTTKEKICYKPNVFIIDFCGAKLYEIFNEAEITSGVMDAGSNNSNEDSSKRRPYLGNLYDFDTESFSFQRMVAKDVHKKLEEYLTKSSISQNVSRLKIGADVKAFITKDMMKGIVITKKGNKLEIQLNELDKNSDPTTRDLPANGSVNDSVSMEDAKISEETTGDSSDYTDEDAAHIALLESNKELFVMSILEKLLLFAAVKKVDENGNAFENLPQLMKYIHGAGSVAAKNFGFLNVMLDVADAAANSLITNGTFTGSLKSIVMRASNSPEEFLEVVNELNRLSSNEVFTTEKPSELLVEKSDLNYGNLEALNNWTKIVHGNGIIDNADKSGMIQYRCFKNGVKILGSEIGEKEASEKISTKLFSIPTSSTTYEIIAELYRMMGWNNNQIFWDQETAESDPWLMQNWALAVAQDNDIVGKMFVDFKNNVLSGEGLVEVSKLFDYCLSNPPYQLVVGQRENGQSKSIAIYPTFQKNAMSISTKSCMIYPASWQNGYIGEKSFGFWLRNNGMKSSNFYLAKDIFDRSIRADYPISIVSCFAGYNGDIKINDNYVGRDNDAWIDTLQKNILVRKTKSFKKLEEGVEQISSLSNIQKSNIDFVSLNDELKIKEIKNPVKIYIKKTATTAADGDDYYADRSNVNKEINPIFIDGFVVAMPYSNFVSNRAFLEIANNPDIGFGTKIFGPNYVFGRTFVKFKCFDTEEEAINFNKYFNTKVIKILSVLDKRPKHFASFVPDLEDYTNNNPVFTPDEKLPVGHEYKGLDLDHRLYKLFNLSEDEIKIIEK